MVVSVPGGVCGIMETKQDLAARSIRIRVGDKVDLAELEHRLIDLELKRTDYVYEPGDFAVRGSIVDVYSFTSELPFRIDFFGDEVDTLRTFNIEDQLSKEQKESVVIVPQL